jgi:ligand-binding SRPBCC domain-containing protein
MRFYQFKRQQLFENSVDELWSFISNPHNLKVITPDYMGFKVTSKELPDKMYEGMIISYKVAPLLGIKTTWVTEITHVKDKHYFVDEQRIGPYAIWHHQHFLEATPKGTLMKDIISYKPPFGILGNVGNALVIKGKLKEIFDYRTKALNELFKEIPT